MSISMRSTKAQMYSEIERLRSLCDWQAQQLRATSQPRQTRQDPELSERRAKLEALKAFATKFRTTARLRNGVIELYSRKRRCWVAVPEGAQP